MLQMTTKSLTEEAAAFINPEKEVNTAEEAIAGACDIIAESISDDADCQCNTNIQHYMLYKRQSRSV